MAQVTIEFQYKNRGVVKTLTVEAPFTIASETIGNIIYHKITDGKGRIHRVKIGPDSYPRNR